MQAIGILAPLIRRLGAQADPRYLTSYSIWAMYAGVLSTCAVSDLELCHLFGNVALLLLSIVTAEYSQ